MEVGMKKVSGTPHIPRKKAQEELDSVRRRETELERLPGRVQREILLAEKICYPGPVYCEILQAAGLSVFPRNYYHFLGAKIAQTDLFNLLEIPHPRTGIYYGRDCSGTNTRTISAILLLQKPPSGHLRARASF